MYGDCEIRFVIVDLLVIKVDLPPEDASRGDGRFRSLLIFLSLFITHYTVLLITHYIEHDRAIIL